MRLYESLTAQKVDPDLPRGRWAFVKRPLLLASLLAGVLLAVVLPGPVGAAGTPCRNKIFNDWYRDGKVASTYSPSCYRDALRHIPVDAGIYSSLIDDIRAALRAAIRRSHGLSAPAVVGHGFKGVRAADVKGRAVIVNAPHDPVAGGTVASSSSGLPLPILVLGGLALALAAAGAIGIGVRYARNRR
jgi:hypothetical protein